MCVNHTFFILSSFLGHLGCFHILVLRNSVAMNIEALKSLKTNFYIRHKANIVSPLAEDKCQKDSVSKLELPNQQWPGQLHSSPATSADLALYRDQVIPFYFLVSSGTYKVTNIHHSWLSYNFINHISQSLLKSSEKFQFCDYWISIEISAVFFL